MKPLTVDDLAAAKRLPAAFLRGLGLRDTDRGVEIPYLNHDGMPGRPRLRSTGPKKFCWAGEEGAPLGAYLLGMDGARTEGIAFIVEGESDAWTLRFLTYGVIALPGNTMSKYLMPEHVKGIDCLYLSQEPGGPGETFIKQVEHRLREIGWEGIKLIIRMPDAIKDPSGLWIDCDGDVEQFYRRLQQATRAGRPTLKVRHLDPADPKHDLSIMTTAAWSTIKGINETPPWLFRSGETIVRIERDDDARPFFREVGASLLRYELAEHIEFLADKTIQNVSVEVPVPPPTILVGNLLATPTPPLPRCRRIVTTPVFAANGRLVDQPGYDAHALLFYEAPAGFSLPPIFPRPTAQDVAAAVKTLTEPFDEFPFKDREIGLANTLGAVLTSFARDLIEGPTPLNLFMKSTPGVGSTLMVQAIGIITTGTAPAMTAPAQDDAEWRKKITSMLIKAPQVVVLDNLRKIDSTALSTVLTAWPTWDDRLLGTNEDVKLPVRCAWLGTGNNIRLTTEQFRRTVRIELEALSERPWLSGIKYRHVPLLPWVTAERVRLVAAALTLVRAWIAAGKPAGAATLGTYESWAAVVGGILAVADVPGFLGNAMDTDVVDDEVGDIKPLLVAWWNNEKFEQHIALSSELFSMIEANPDIAPHLKGTTEHARRSEFGLLLRDRYKNRVYDIADDLTVRLVRPEGQKHDKKPRWQLIRFAGGGAVGAVGVRGGISPKTKSNPAASAPGDPQDRSEGERKTLPRPPAPPRGLDPDDPPE